MFVDGNLIIDQNILDLRCSVTPEAMDSYLNTPYGQSLKAELDDLVKSGKLVTVQREMVLRLKANEYYKECIERKIYDDVTYYLENFPELFTIHDILIQKEPVLKQFFVINCVAEHEFEKILSFQGISFEKHSKELPDKRIINVYIALLVNPRKYKLEDNPMRKAWTMAEDAGIRIGFYDYGYTSHFLSLGGYRSFPITVDRYGDLSSASGGLREDLGVGFKSSWEANVARLLNAKGIAWTYEKKFIQTENGAYIPDFNVTQEGLNYNIEVKGFWDDRSVKKISSARSQEGKEGKVVIIDGDIYSLINYRYAMKIPHWEEGLVSTRNETIPVVGIHVGNRLKTIKELSEGDNLKLVREPENIYDNNAIRVYTTDDREIGFVAKDWASIFAYKIDIGFTYEANLVKTEIEKKVVYIRLTTKPASDELLNRIPIFMNPLN